MTPAASDQLQSRLTQQRIETMSVWQAHRLARAHHQRQGNLVGVQQCQDQMKKLSMVLEGVERQIGELIGPRKFREIS
jgi:hypothetical protein